MDESDSVFVMRQEISNRFTVEARRADTHLVENYYDSDAHAIWLEIFSQATTDAMKRRDEKVVKEHLLFMAEQLERADDTVRHYIDVYYVESLMWDLNDKDKPWAWSLIPGSLKQLYVEIWGEPQF